MLTCLAPGCQEKESKGFPYTRSQRPSSLHFYLHEERIEHSIVDYSLNWGPEGSALLLINCMTLDKSFVFSLLMYEMEIDIAAQTISRKDGETQSNVCAL